MKIELYPEFEEVFENDDLKGVFYPLCKVSEINSSMNSPLFFVSSNGIWVNENIKNEYNQASFTCFEMNNGKYSFKGDLNVYLGYEQAPKIIENLEADFKQNGERYLAQKIKTESYIQNILENYNLDFGELDAKYFLQTFYQFSINKLIYQKTGNFGAFNQIIYDWDQPDESPIIYEIKNDNTTGYADIEINKEYFFPKSIEIEKYEKVGFVIGHEFFTDGNDTYLIYDKENHRAICINHYS
ncbi:hypothetical protein AAG747_04730 [Rapidithrix thailandica]|uniref:Uncharacterized protein n=1 Tax=Rapidithrix thailandica TaxID=413964 RepID=A0AAW9S457_9BACT